MKELTAEKVLKPVVFRYLQRVLPAEGCKLRVIGRDNKIRKVRAEVERLHNEGKTTAEIAKAVEKGTRWVNKIKAGLRS